MVVLFVVLHESFFSCMWEDDLSHVQVEPYTVFYQSQKSHSQESLLVMHDFLGGNFRVVFCVDSSHLAVIHNLRKQL